MAGATGEHFRWCNEEGSRGNDYKVTNDFRWTGKAESGSFNLKQIEKNKNMVYFDVNFRKKVHRRNGKT